MSFCCFASALISSFHCWFCTSLVWEKTTNPMVSFWSCSYTGADSIFYDLPKRIPRTPRGSTLCTLSQYRDIRGSRLSPQKYTIARYAGYTSDLFTGYDQALYDDERSYRKRDRWPTFFVDIGALKDTKKWDFIVSYRFFTTSWYRLAYGVITRSSQCQVTQLVQETLFLCCLFLKDGLFSFWYIDLYL